PLGEQQRRRARDLHHDRQHARDRTATGGSLMGRVLIVDDEPGMRRILISNLRRDGHVLVEAAGAAEAKSQLAKDEYDVVLTDHKMPDGSGLDVLHAAQQDDATTSVIFLTAVGTLELAVESMREGAFDFLTKPFVPDVVRSAVNRAC